MLVEIALAKRKWIERVEQLCHLLDAHLDRTGHALLAHFIILVDVSLLRIANSLSSSISRAC